MKVEGNGPNLNAGITERLDATRAADRKRLDDTAGATAAGGDRVQLSADAKLAAAATDAAQRAPDVRADKVAQAKAKLASGDLGADAAKLADAVIDDLLKE